MKFVLAILFTATISFAQTGVSEGKVLLNTSVQGIFQSGGSYYLVTENGWLIVRGNSSQNDQLTEYYRRIYNDSTIVSPNTIIEPDNSALQFINPIIDINEWTTGYSPVADKVYLHTFMHMDSTGKFVFRPGVSAIINKIYNEQR